MDQGTNQEDRQQMGGIVAIEEPFGNALAGTGTEEDERKCQQSKELEADPQRPQMAGQGIFRGAALQRRQVAEDIE